VNFAEQPPSKQWAALKYRGKQFAEVWLKPADEPFALIIRIPRASFQAPSVGPMLTPENLLKAVGIATEQVESWRHEGAPQPGTEESGSGLGQALPPPAEGAAHLSLHVNLKPPPPPAPAAPAEGCQPEIPEEKWQELEGRWKTILGLEATIDTLRITMEALQTDMQGSLKKTLATEEKLHALHADVAIWNKAKARVHYVLPKLREAIHRATWAVGAPERKKLDELLKNYVEPRIPFPEIDKVLEQLEYLLKDRQVLSANAMTVYQECKNVSADVQGALRTLLSNSAANAERKRRAGRAKGKFFKDIRRWTGVD
jgi:hypothetical protein